MNKQITPCLVLTSLMSASPTLANAIEEHNTLAFDSKEWLEIAEMQASFEIDPLTTAEEGYIFELIVELDDGAILTVFQKKEETYTTCSLMLACESDGVTERAMRIDNERIGDLVELPAILAPLADYRGTTEMARVDRCKDEGVTYVPLNLVISAQETILRDDAVKVDIKEEIGEKCDVLAMIKAATASV